MVDSDTAAFLGGTRSAQTVLLSLFMLCADKPDSGLPAVPQAVKALIDQAGNAEDDAVRLEILKRLEKAPGPGGPVAL